MIVEDVKDEVKAALPDWYVWGSTLDMFTEIENDAGQTVYFAPDPPARTLFIASSAPEMSAVHAVLKGRDLTIQEVRLEVEKLQNNHP
jgi:hypothetical protein